jgi:hypothetical protein
VTEFQARLATQSASLVPNGQADAGGTSTATRRILFAERFAAIATEERSHRWRDQVFATHEACGRKKHVEGRRRGTANSGADAVRCRLQRRAYVTQPRINR